MKDYRRICASCRQPINRRDDYVELEIYYDHWSWEKRIISPLHIKCYDAVFMEKSKKKEIDMCELCGRTIFDPLGKKGKTLCQPCYFSLEYNLKSPN